VRGVPLDAAADRVLDRRGLQPEFDSLHESFHASDEKPQVQALQRTAPILPLRPGIPEKQTHD
jgi:hypothetical protein